MCDIRVANALNYHENYPLCFWPEYTKFRLRMHPFLREMPRNLRETQKVWLFVQLHKALLQMGAGHRAENSICKKPELTY